MQPLCTLSRDVIQDGCRPRVAQHTSGMVSNRLFLWLSLKDGAPRPSAAHTKSRAGSCCLVGSSTLCHARLRSARGWSTMGRRAAGSAMPRIPKPRLICLWAHYRTLYWWIVYWLSSDVGQVNEAFARKEEQKEIGQLEHNKPRRLHHL